MGGACQPVAKRYQNNHASNYNNVPVPNNNVQQPIPRYISNNNFNGSMPNVAKPLNFPPGEKYYLNIRNQEAYKGEVIGGKQRVQITLALKFTNASYSSNAQAFRIGVSLSMLSNKYSFQDLGATTPLKNGVLIFETAYKVDYLFEEHQTLKFDILYNDSPRESVETTIGRIFGSMAKTVEFPLNKCIGVVLVASCCAVKQESENTLIKFTFQPQVQSYSNYFAVISSNTMNTWQNVYKSKESKLPTIETGLIKINEINNGDLEKLVQFEVYEENMGKVGGIEASLNELTKMNGNVMLNTGINCRIWFKSQQEVKFVDYIQNGLQISVMCAIDFTGSNGEPHLPSSLHYMGGQEPNHYEQALRACSSIVTYYDYDQKFPVFGFGGKVNGTTSHCFPCNLMVDPNVMGVEGIIDSYKFSLNNVKLDGPTYFSPVFKSMINSVKRAMNEKVNSYYVFMILTDGEIIDMNETKDMIYEASFLPISFIIVGIGNSDFGNMVALDGDDVELTNSKGQKVGRDIVQFVKYNSYKVDSNKLAQEVLKEIPRQVEMYFRKHNNFKANI
jgi:hypothetical protein